jgi:protein phosphatase 1 regulatory subunit 3A/B/C/D/E
MPAMMVMSEVSTSSPGGCRLQTDDDSTSAIDIGRPSFPINCHRSAALDFDTYLLSSSPPGFEIAAKCPYQSSPLSSFIEPSGVRPPSAEGRRKHFFTPPSLSSSSTAKSDSEECVGLSDRRWMSSNGLCQPQQQQQQKEPRRKTGLTLLSTADFEDSLFDANVLLATKNASNFNRCSCCGNRSTRKSASMPTYTTPRKKVSFADDVGKLLESIRIFAESSDTPPEIGRHVISRYEKAAADGTSVGVSDACRLALVPDFTMPRDNRSALIDRVDRNCVSLESVRLVAVPRFSSIGAGTSEAATEYQLVGTVLVKNLSFDKSVSVRCTFDDWLSFQDSSAVFIRSEFPAGGTYPQRGGYGGISSLPAPHFDVFEFRIDMPSATAAVACNGGSSVASAATNVQLAVCFESPGDNGEKKRYWDNNDGRNYRLELRPVAAFPGKEVTSTTAGAGMSCVTDYASWNRVDMTSPYW